MKTITLLLTLSLSVGVLNAQDTCATAVAIQAGLHTVAGVDGTDVPNPLCTGGATPSAGEWYSYTPTQDYSVTVTTDLIQNAGGDTRFHVYTGSCGNVTCVGGDDDGGTIDNGYLSIDTFDVTGGTTYYIVFDNRWNAGGFDFELSEDIISPPPPTECGDAVCFTQQSVSTSGSNRAVVDMNGDFLDDIVSVTSTNVNILYQQTDGTFNTVNIATSQADYTSSWSLAAADYNRDGYTDLLYGGNQGVTFMKSDGTGSGFTETSGSEYVFSQRSNFIDINNDGHLDAFVCHDVDANVFYINDGNGNLSFNQGPLGTVRGNYGSVWIDYDNDRDMDMFIAKCGGGPINQMFTNNGDGTYTDTAPAQGLDDTIQTWSSAWGDYDNDGDMDAYIGASSGVSKLLRNDGNGVFVDVTSASGVLSLTSTGIENCTYDLDNDGNLDIISHGNVLIGNGDMTFTLESGKLNGSNGSFGDLNNDGFIDGFNTGTISMNDGNANNWVTINTVGVQSNINGIGARVEVYTTNTASETVKRIRDVRSGEGFRYMSTLNTHFGLGTDAAIDQIVIYWPSGIVDTYYDPNINTTLNYVEGQGQTLDTTDNSLSDVSIYPNPVQDILTITTSGNLNNKIATVFDINGKRVLNTKLENTRAINVSKLSAGFYILRLESEGKSITRKFIKK